MGALDGKVALVTGGTRGIGRAIAEDFLAEGALVMVNGRSKEKGEEALEEMGGGDRAGFVAGDVKVEDDCTAMVDATIERFGGIDILVNNAGGASIHAPVHEATTELIDDAMVWNLHSTVWCTRQALPSMYEKGWGRVINISSIEGKIAKPGIVGYVVAKHAVNGFTKVAAMEGAAAGVTVNAICPRRHRDRHHAGVGSRRRRRGRHQLRRAARLLRPGQPDEAAQHGGRRSPPWPRCWPRRPGEGSPGSASTSTAARC